MTVRVLRVRRRSSDNKRAPHYQGTKHIRKRLDGICYEGIGMSHDTRGEFARGKNKINGKAD
jgi:hypothetical protein